jgi:hypothetical protein
LQVVAIHIKPLATESNEPADLPQSGGFARYLEARNEFHNAVVIGRAAAVRAEYLQTQPSLRRVKADLAGSGVRVPAGEEVAGVLQYKCCISGAHQCLGSGGGRGIVQDWRAACRMVDQAAAWAGRY